MPSVAYLRLAAPGGGGRGGGPPDDLLLDFESSVESVPRLRLPFLRLNLLQWSNRQHNVQHDKTKKRMLPTDQYRHVHANIFSILLRTRA